MYRLYSIDYNEPTIIEDITVPLGLYHFFLLNISIFFCQHSPNDITRC